MSQHHLDSELSKKISSENAVTQHTGSEAERMSKSTKATDPNHIIELIIQEISSQTKKKEANSKSLYSRQISMQLKDFNYAEYLPRCILCETKITKSSKMVQTGMRVIRKIWII